jgi:hypothetical protein
MNRINADREKQSRNLKQKHQIELLQKQKQKVNAYKDGVLLIREREIARGLVESVDVLNRVGINSQEASALMWLHSITTYHKL